MNALPALWLLFLPLIKSNPPPPPPPPPNPFQLPDSRLTATEGSCVEIKCSVSNKYKGTADHFFWMVNKSWSDTEKKFQGTVIYSTNEKERPVSPAFAGRVTYAGTQVSSWLNSSPNFCSITVCKLRTNDSGIYAFRFIGKESKYKFIAQQETTLTVRENPCPITFLPPSFIERSGNVTLTCSTLSSCSVPEIGGLEQLGPSRRPNPQQDFSTRHRKTTSVRFSADWQDDGKQFSCQTGDNTDKHLIQNVTVTVAYPPQEVLAKISPEIIVEGSRVNLSCSAKGRPDPIFIWLKNGIEWETKAELIIQSVWKSDNAEYQCEAKNKYGKTKSSPVTIKVQYKPEVELKFSANEVEQGEKVTLTCEVMRAEPQPSSYVWLRNGIEESRRTTNPYVIERIEPEQRGKYKCEATNTAGTGKSAEILITVKYGPRNTKISIGRDDKKVKVGASLTFICETDANPPADTYFWSRQNQKVSVSKQTSQRKLETASSQNVLELNNVQRGDEACYTCNATNSINRGGNSEPLCIQVLYAPTKPRLSMSTEGREGQLFTIRCSVESFPPSTFTLTRTSASNPRSSKVLNSQTDYHQPPNNVRLDFNLTSDDAGVYTCKAENSQSSSTSDPVELVVKYPPKHVTVTAAFGFVVNENKPLTLRCNTKSHPPVTSVTWTKTTDGRSEIIGWNQDFTLKSVRPSDRGRYSCTARNEMGAGNSLQAEVKVKYAPKHTKITAAAEQQRPDGTSFVKLSCSSDSYPTIQQYSWYKKSSEGKDKKVSSHKDFTVYSYEAGSYYCVAKNEINEGLSEPVHLFDDSWKKVLIIILLAVLLLIVAVVLVYRHKRKKSAHRGATNNNSCLAFPAGLRDARMNRMNNPAMAEPFRSRDDLLPDQPRCPKARRCQPRPDDTPASNTACVYSTVNLPSATQGPSAQKPVRQQRGHAEDDSLNYASLHHGNKQMNKRAKEVEDVYAIVSKQKPLKKNDEVLEDYENFSAAHTRGPPKPLNSDSDTSEDEVEINYSKVSFRAKPGHQRAHSDSSSSDEETQYSQVKI